MKPDPTIESICEVRRQISASVGHDPRKLVEHYQQLQDRHRDRIVSRNVEDSKPKSEDVAQQRNQVDDEGNEQ